MNRVENYLLGMDCGTTNIKAVIIGEDGTVVAEASRPNCFICPGPGMQEQDAGRWWENSVEIFRALCEKAGMEVVRRIRGIGISSHTVTMLPVDKDGVPLRNALTYQDTRSGGELDDILDTIGWEHFVNIVGGRPGAGFLPSKILWFKKNEPELFAKTSSFMQASSYINFKLTGKRTIDIDQAARTQCLDINTMDWASEIGNAIGVDLDLVMPPLKLVNEIIGFVTDEAADETGLVSGIPVIAGCSDAMASMYAMGMSRLGEAGESSGTSSLVFVGSDVKSAPDLPVVTKPCAITGMPWVFDAPITTTGLALNWYIETMAAEERAAAKEQGKDIYTYLNELALEAEPGSGGLLFYPYLMGERAPIWKDYARSMFIGMSISTTRAEMARSVFEGTAFALRHVIETIGKAGAGAGMLRITGGGAKSRTWSRIKAAVLDMPVYVLDERSGNVPVGDALIAGHKLGVFPDLSEAAERLVKIDEVIEPDREWVDRYEKIYPFYKEIFLHLDQDLRGLRSVVERMGM
ncbi:carbohydrate kinase [Clostridiales bacterium TF09-2AC]|nr:carbohydrate kinase [Clostridiales bacterium TF09-2AC]